MTLLIAHILRTNIKLILIQQKLIKRKNSSSTLNGILLRISIQPILAKKETDCKKETTMKELYEQITYLINIYNIACKMKVQKTFYRKILQVFKVLEK